MTKEDKIKYCLVLLDLQTYLADVQGKCAPLAMNAHHDVSLTLEQINVLATLATMACASASKVHKREFMSALNIHNQIHD